MNPARALFANDAFYLAFASRDSEAMEAIWARHHPVTCIHPGWPALTERDEVVEGWLQILASDDPPDISAHDARAFPYGDAVLVICYELIGEQVLVASNLFVAEDGEARLVHHQAGPCARPPETAMAPEPVQ